MTKKDYEAAARIAQERPCRPKGCFGHIKDAVSCPVEAFVDLFKADSSAFDEAHFRRACVPGANVRARG